MAGLAAAIVGLSGKVEEDVSAAISTAGDEWVELMGITTEDIQSAVEDYGKKYGLAPTLTDPSKDTPYVEVTGLPNAYQTFQLTDASMLDSARSGALETLEKLHVQYRAKSLGYPINQNLQLDSTSFATFLNISANNTGDPFEEDSNILSTKFLERSVLDYFAKLWHVQYPHDKDAAESYWGVCLSQGDSEGNLYGMRNARDYLSGKRIMIENSVKIVKKADGTSSQLTVPRYAYRSASKSEADNQNAYIPISFYSGDTHYSMSKAMTLLSLRTFCAEGKENYPGMCPLEGYNGVWPAEVPSDDSGAMDLDALAELVEFFASKGHPIIVCFSYGTAQKGAYDDVASACDKLRPILETYNLLERVVNYDEDDDSKFETRTGYWFHVDGGHGAAYMPFIEMAQKGGLMENRGPEFDFRLAMVNSISASSDKWIGSGVPGGVYLTRTKYQMLPPEIPEYIGTPDTTFAGSRNGLSPMALWDTIARKSYAEQVREAIRLDQLAAYAETRLLGLQEKILQQDLFVQRSPLSLAIRFKRASDDIRLKYSLSDEDVNGVQYSQIFIMDHITKDLIDELVADLAQLGAFA